MKNEIAYKRLIAKILENKEEEFPVLFSATDVNKKTYLLKSEVRKGREEQDQQDVCAMFKLLFALKDIEEYTVLFPTKLNDNNLVIVAEVNKKQIETKFLELKDDVIHSFPQIEVSNVSQGLFTKLLPNEVAHHCLTSTATKKAMEEFWERVLFEVRLEKLNFNRLRKMFSE